MKRRSFLLGLVVTPAVASLPELAPAPALKATGYPTPGEFYRIPHHVEITRAGIYHLSTVFAGIPTPGLYELQADGITLASEQIDKGLAQMALCMEINLTAIVMLEPGQRVHWPTVPEGSQLESRFRVTRVG
jgi:hypothetical protein